MSDRALATVEVVQKVNDIPGADNIVRARVRGWDVVVKRDEFVPGERCVYFEVDSMVDVADPRFAFLAPRGVRTDVEGRTGHVLKTVRLRGQYSQGLALSLEEFPELCDVPVGSDVTEVLGVHRWDPPMPASQAGTVRGMRPGWFPKTDEERVQNVAEVLAVRDVPWVATEKVDGMSMSVYVNPPERYGGVCTRNLDLRREDGNTLWALAERHDLHARLWETYTGVRSVVQGEAYGEGIQSNPLRVRGQRFLAFTLWVDGSEVPRRVWPVWLHDLSVPEVGLPFPSSVEEALAQVERMASGISTDRPAEGVVWRGEDRTDVELPSGQVVRASFKVISNRYLLKNDR